MAEGRVGRMVAAHTWWLTKRVHSSRVKVMSWLKVSTT